MLSVSAMVRNDFDHTQSDTFGCYDESNLGGIEKREWNNRRISELPHIKRYANDIPELRIPFEQLYEVDANDKERWR